MPLRRCVEICALRVVLGGSRPPDPVHLLAAWAVLNNHPLRCMAAAQAAQLQRLERFQRHIGDVDVEQPRRSV